MALVKAIMLSGGSAKAQDQAAPLTSGSNAQPTTQFPEVLIVGEQGYQGRSLSLYKYGEPLLTTPQSASVVTRQLMEDENVTSMHSAPSKKD